MKVLKFIIIEYYLHMTACPSGRVVKLLIVSALKNVNGLW